MIDKDECNLAMSRVGLDQLDGLRESLSRNELSRTRSIVFDREGTRLPSSVQYGDADAGDGDGGGGAGQRGRRERGGARQCGRSVGTTGGASTGRRRRSRCPTGSTRTMQWQDGVG